jgi:hypothetical protein
MTENINHAIEAFPEDVVKTPPKPKGETVSFEEFKKDPKGYSMARGLRPQGLRTRVIMPTTVQVRKLDGTFGEKVVDILRRIDFSRNYRGRMGIKDIIRMSYHVELSPEHRDAINRVFNTGSVA